MNIKELLQRRADLVKEGKALFDRAREEGRRLTPEEQARDDAIQAEVEALTADIERVRRQMDRERMAAAVEAVLGDGTGPAPRGDAPAHPTKVAREAFRQYLRYGIQGVRDPDLRAALVSNQDNLGGFLVPEDFRAELLRDLAGFAVVRPMARVLTTSRDAAVFPALASGTDPYATNVNTDSWKTEGELITSVTSRTTQDKPTFERARIPLHYWSPDPIVVSNSLLNDSAVDLDAELRRILAETKALDEDKAFLVGSGVGRPKGVIQDAIDGQITTVNSGAAANITYNGLVDLFTSLPAQYRSRAVWVMNSTTYGEVLKLKDAQNRPLVDVNTTPTVLWGRPIVFSEFLDDPIAGGKPIIFGDFGFYGIADHESGLSVVRLAELYAPSVALLSYGRLGGQVLRTSAFRVMNVAA